MKLNPRIKVKTLRSKCSIKSLYSGHNPMQCFNSTEKKENLKKPGSSSQLYWILLFIHHCLLKGSILMGAVIITVSSSRRQKLNGQHWHEGQSHLKTQTHAFAMISLTCVCLPTTYTVLASYMTWILKMHHVCKSKSATVEFWIGLILVWVEGHQSLLSI